MAAHFCLSVRLLDQMYHGRGDGGRPEWPPSPLRLFQALVAAAARRNGGELSGAARAALHRMEGAMGTPVIVAPVAVTGAGYRLSVPNNAMDIVARAWAKGNDAGSGDADPRKHRTMKAVTPKLLDGEAVHYLWRVTGPVDEEFQADLRTLAESARSIAALGWGMDLAIGHGTLLDEEGVAKLAGVKWLPGSDGGTEGLRVPATGALDDAIRHYEEFLKRVGDGGFVPPPPLSKFRKVEYRRDAEPVGGTFAAFLLRMSEGEGFRQFDAARRGLTVSGMLRGAVKAAAERGGWAQAKIASFVLGHGEAIGESNRAVAGARFAYVAAPSIEPRKNGVVASSIRRVLVLGVGGDCAGEVEWAQRALSGAVLRSDGAGKIEAELEAVTKHDWVLQCYTKPATAWATVTPVVLPGYDDPRHYRRRMEKGVSAAEQRRLVQELDARTDGLLRKAMVQAGLTEALARDAELDWSRTGFWAGTDAADRYGVPDHLRRFPRYHVKVRWGYAVPGPICIGGGRYYGLGLMAALQE